MIYFFFFFGHHLVSGGWEAWENSGTPYVWPTWRDCSCSFNSFDAGGSDSNCPNWWKINGQTTLTKFHRRTRLDSRWKETTCHLFSLFLSFFFCFVFFGPAPSTDNLAPFSITTLFLRSLTLRNGAPVTPRNVRVRCSRKRVLGRRRTDSKTQNGGEIRFVNIVSCFTIVNNNNNE